MGALMMEAVRTSETSVSIYQTTWRNIPEESRLHIRHVAQIRIHILGFDISDPETLHFTSTGELVTYFIGQKLTHVLFTYDADH
jgi:hypothetical protein